MPEITRDDRQLLFENFPVYSLNCLKIQTKSRGLQKFTMNRAQMYVHDKLEDQLRSQGYVRALVLKGRQQGMSTYIGGRYYWKVTHRKGVNAFVITHRSDTTAALFGMTSRYHENCPVNLKPETKAASSNELWFDKLDSRYRVGTAGGEQVGRGLTLQYVHCSEVAFWDNADEHLKGIFQAVPSGMDAIGTEVVMESTANGVGNAFFQLWQQAEKGVGEYVAVFVPWFWQDEYRSPLPRPAPDAPLGSGWKPDAENQEYGELYGLTWEQLRWRELKLLEFKGDVGKFRQEYPATSTEAFESSGENVFLLPGIVMKARKMDLPAALIYGPKIVGVDVARFGDDNTCFVMRQGRKVINVKTVSKFDTMEVVGAMLNMIEDWKPDRVFIDVGNMGTGVYDRLKELGHGQLVKPIEFGSSARRADRYPNKRHEMWGLMKEWFHQEGGVQIPDDDRYHGDLTRITYTSDSNGRDKLESKKDMRKRGIKSPDFADALALTFAAPVAGQFGGKEEFNRRFDRQELADSNDGDPFAR